MLQSDDVQQGQHSTDASAAVRGLSPFQQGDSGTSDSSRGTATDPPPADPQPQTHTSPEPKTTISALDLIYKQYAHPHDEPLYLPLIRALISKDLSEPYSIYVYRYFLYHWGHLCFMALSASPTDPSTPELIGVVVNKLEPHGKTPLRGYIAMLAVQETHRGKGIATELVKRSIEAMKEQGADEIVLETEVSNRASLKLYQRLGFMRAKQLHRYYLNGNNAFRLGLYFKDGWGRPPGRSSRMYYEPEVEDDKAEEDKQKETLAMPMREAGVPEGGAPMLNTSAGKGKQRQT